MKYDLLVAARLLCQKANLNLSSQLSLCMLSEMNIINNSLFKSNQKISTSNLFADSDHALLPDNPLYDYNTIKTYLINVDRDIDRLSHMNVQLNHAGIKFKRIKAVTPDSMKHVNINITSDIFFSSAYVPANLLSHLKALLHFASFCQSCNDVALVLEDDATLSPTLTSNTLFKILKSAPDDFDILQLGTSHLASAECLFEYRKNFNLVWHNWHYPFWGTHAYLITSSAAVKVVKKLFFNLEIDLRKSFCPDLCVADFLLYSICNTYTSTYPWFGQCSLDSTVRPDSINDEFEMIKRRNNFLHASWETPPS